MYDKSICKALSMVGWAFVCLCLVAFLCGGLIYTYHASANISQYASEVEIAEHLSNIAFGKTFFFSFIPLGVIGLLLLGLRHMVAASLLYISKNAAAEEE